MTNVNEYLEYRDWLNDLFELKRKESSLWSYRWLAAQIDMDAGNLVKVLQKKRHMPIGSLIHFADLVLLTTNEIEFLEVLYAFNKSRSEEKSRDLFEKLLELKFVKLKSLEADQYKYYGDWKYTPLLALIHLNGEIKDFKSLGKMMDPPIGTEEVQKGIELLETLKLIRKVSEFKWAVSHNMVQAGDKIKSWAIHSYQKQNLDLAKRSLDFHSSTERDFSTLTITANDTDLKKIKEMTKEFRRQVLNLIKESDHQDRVYQMNIQLFPQSKKVES